LGRFAGSTGGRRAITLIELLVALTITIIFVGSVSVAFVQIIRSTDRANAEMRANSSARAAVDKIARDLRAIVLDSNPSYQQFVLRDNTLPYGNNVDEDNDGAADEDLIDGRDLDGDWTLADDYHATIGSQTERVDYVGAADLGDYHVDEDFPFSRDEVTFIQPGRIVGITIIPRRRVTYRIGTFDSENYVLLRDVEDNPPVATPGTIASEPVVFEAVSLDMLAWNANDNAVSPVPGRPYWQSSWDATSIAFPAVRPIGAPFGVPPFKLPAAMYISVTVSAEGVPLSEIGGWPTGSRPLKTVTLSTVVNIETTVQDSRYFFYVRP